MAGSHRVEVAFPADSSKGAGLAHRSRRAGQRSQGKVDRLLPGWELVAPHDIGTGTIVDVYVGA